MPCLSLKSSSPSPFLKPLTSAVALALAVAVALDLEPTYRGGGEDGEAEYGLSSRTKKTHRFVWSQTVIFGWVPRSRLLLGRERLLQTQNSQRETARYRRVVGLPCQLAPVYASRFEPVRLSLAPLGPGAVGWALTLSRSFATINLKVNVVPSPRRKKWAALYGSGPLFLYVHRRTRHGRKSIRPRRTRVDYADTALPARS